MAMSEKEMSDKLDEIQEGDTVFVSYHAGRAPTDRAQEEAEKAADEGYTRRWFLGRLEGKWTTKKGQKVFCVYTLTRYNSKDPAAEGHYRTFNPQLGKLLALEKVS